MTPENPSRDPEEIPLADEPRRHRFLWGLALVCLFLSVPFYYPAGRVPELILGLPDWCWVTLLADLLFAVVVAYLVLATWRETDGEG